MEYYVFRLIFCMGLISLIFAEIHIKDVNVFLQILWVGFSLFLIGMSLDEMYGNKN